MVLSIRAYVAAFVVLSLLLLLPPLSSVVPLSVLAREFLGSPERVEMAIRNVQNEDRSIAFAAALSVVMF